MDGRVRLVEKAAELLGQDTVPILTRLMKCDGGDWYLQEKIAGAPNHETLLDNTRPLKYAACFVDNGATVAFVRETSTQTPDLRVEVGLRTFYVEVRKFRMGLGDAPLHPASKIVDAVQRKRSQLPRGEIGFVAIDNFDLRLEPGFRHNLIAEGLREIGRMAASNPNGWRRPSGVIVSAASNVSSGPGWVDFPHFIWRNQHGECPPPDQLVKWLVSSLPSGSVFEN